MPLIRRGIGYLMALDARIGFRKVWVGRTSNGLSLRAPGVK